MTTQKRSVLLAVLTFMLALSLVASGMYALFSNRVTLTNHLQAGTLDLKLTRTHLEVASLDAKSGAIVVSENPADVDFTVPDRKNPNRNMFDVTEDTNMAPGCWYSAQMQLTNIGGVRLGYWLEIVFDDTADLTLAEQLKITVTTVGGTTSGMLDVSTGLIGGEDNPIEILTAAGSALFTVRVDFCDLDYSVNNNAKGSFFYFDVVVHAVQIPMTPSA